MMTNSLIGLNVTIVLDGIIQNVLKQLQRRLRMIGSHMKYGIVDIVQFKMYSFRGIFKKKKTDFKNLELVFIFSKSMSKER